MDLINYDEFKRIELRVAKILEAERVEGSDKLLKLKLSLGVEERQIVSGIAKAHDPVALIGREIIIVANLEPRKLMGLESAGMLLAADSSGGPVLLQPDREVESGSVIK